ncbi:unnamed protein product [Malus baccata var. baccata]
MVKDAKALGIIQGAVSDEIFPRIAILETTKEAWDVLKQQFVGDKQVRSVKLQRICRLLMCRMFVIENTRDLDTVNVHDVVATLKGYEQRIERHSENSSEKAFASLSIAPKMNNYNANQNFKPTKNWKTNGNKWDNKHVHQQGKFVGTSDEAKNPFKYCDKFHFGECWFKGKPRCHNCDKLGHFAKDCRSKKAAKQVNYVSQVENTPTIFYVYMSTAVKKSEDIWYVDSGYNNHMTGRKNLLVNTDRSVTAKGEMGTWQLVNVVGKM